MNTQVERGLGVPDKVRPGRKCMGAATTSNFY
jgi:hypothetical protein